MRPGCRDRASNRQGRGVEAKVPDESKALGRGVEARAMQDSKDLGRGVTAKAKTREDKARGGEGTLRGAAWAGRDPTVQAGRQGSR